MIATFDFDTALWVVCIVNVSFAVGLLLLSSDRVWDGARLWFVGNVCGLGAALLRLSIGSSAASPIESILPATLMMLTNLFKVAALVRKRQRGRVAIIGATIVATQLFAAWVDDRSDSLNLAIGTSALFLGAVLAWQAYICFVDPRWKRQRGRNLFVTSTALIAIFSCVAAVRGFGITPGLVIFSAGGLSQLNLLIMLAYVIFSQICVIAMVMDRLNRTVIVGELRQRKESRLARLAEAHALQMAAIAHEKQSLLEVLIHEVRQPLNNAQAALQNVMLAFDLNSRDHEAGRKLQAIIDKIVLSLSNAIVGASVLERQTQSQLATTDLVSICELACSDIGPGWEGRIDLQSGQDPIFVEADPVLLRLAVRNLVDNAIKHTCAGNKATVSVVHDPVAAGIAISVSNWPSEPFSFNPSLFERGARGSNASPEGRGLGLYIAREIALLHNGTIAGGANQAGQTVFVLTVPV